MCHRCQDRDWVTGEARERICVGKNISPDMTATPYSYQQIMLRSDYSVVGGFYSKKSKQNVLDGKTLKSYVHPFMFTYTASQTCSRYTCLTCIKEKQEHE